MRRWRGWCIGALICGLGLTGAASATERRQPSPAAASAFAKKQWLQFHALIVDETEACLASERDSFECLDLLLIARSNHGVVHGERSARLATLAAERVLALYGGTPDLLVDAPGGPAADSAEALVALVQAAGPGAFSVDATANALLRNAVARHALALGEIGVARQMSVGSLTGGMANEAVIQESGSDSAVVLTLRGNRAALFGPATPAHGGIMKMFDYTLADAEVREIAAVRARTGPPLAFAIASINLARRMHDNGDFVGADRLYEMHVPAIEAAWGAGEVRVLQTRAAHANTLLSLGRIAEAIGRLDAARAGGAAGEEAQLRVLAVDAVRVRALVDAGRVAEARTAGERALKIVEGPVDVRAVAIVRSISGRLAANAYLRDRTRDLFKVDPELREKERETVRAALHDAMAGVEQAAGDLAAALAHARAAHMLQPYNHRYLLHRVTLELPAGDQWTLQSRIPELGSLIAQLTTGSDDRIQAQALRGAATIAASRVFLPAVADMRGVLRAIPERVGARAFNDVEAGRELKRYSPYLRSVVMAHWAATKELERGLRWPP